MGPRYWDSSNRMGVLIKAPIFLTNVLLPNTNYPLPATYYPILFIKLQGLFNLYMRANTLTLLISVFYSFVTYSQPEARVNYNIFYSPSDGPYAEIFITANPTTLRFVRFE